MIYAVSNAVAAAVGWSGCRSKCGGQCEDISFSRKRVDGEDGRMRKSFLTPEDLSEKRVWGERK